MTTDAEREYNDIQHRFTYHPPSSNKVSMTHAYARDMLHDVAQQLNSLLPGSREKALVMTKLEEAMFWANAAIARWMNTDAAK